MVQQALTELGDKLVQEDATIAALSMEVTSQNEAIRAKMNADMDTMTAHMRELNAKLDSDMGAHVSGGSVYLSYIIITSV